MKRAVIDLGDDLKLYIQGALLQLSQEKADEYPEVANPEVDKFDLFAYVHRFIWLKKGYVSFASLREVLLSDKNKMLVADSDIRDPSKVRLLKTKQYERYLLEPFKDTQAPRRSQIAGELLGYSPVVAVAAPERVRQQNLF